MSTKDKLIGPYVMSFDVTYKCTMRCKHCFNVSGEHKFDKSELDNETFISVIEDIARLQPKVICFCGGEPLLRKDIICKACELLFEKTNGMTKANVVTNGELMTHDIALKLKESHFQLIQVSLDGARPKTHDWLRNKEGAFNKAVNAIKHLKDAGMYVGVAFTPTLHNIDEVDEAINLCEELGVNEFRMQPLMPLGRAMSQLKEYIPQYKDYKKVSLKLNGLRFNYEALGKIKIEWGDPVDHLIRFRTILSDNCLHLGINAYGDITLSPYLPITLGNIQKHSLCDYWSNGLNRAWNIPIVNYFAERMMSSSNLRSTDPDIELPVVYLDKGIELDLIEDDLLNMPSKQILENIV